MLKQLTHFIAIVCAIVLSVCLFIFNPYMHATTFKAEVVDKMVLKAGYKASERLVVVYKRQSDGIVFDIGTSVSTYTGSHPGDVHTLTLSPHDYMQTKWDDFRYMILPIAVAAITAFWAIIFMIATPLTSKPDDKKSGTASPRRSALE